MTTPTQGHDVHSIVAPRGIKSGGVLTCQCGWVKSYEHLTEALRAHERHQWFAAIFAKTWMVTA